ncbi:HNH endonuclease [Pseudoduganella violacea]|uniref:HNH nuclease domain-containing protein n=1 Tax=Pseudoduganella violacea TaxID=1715466 RepID=A0A7W5B7F6_9BURK|nr:HNH endonuclease signature motif containing protein [Pseudoduganella violacea]MBB3117959.1 hypothetical protein [Pseudoduganella violacea]
MKVYFINTDAASNGGASYHDKWLSQQIAVTSGEGKYYSTLAKVKRGDILLMYVNATGIVAAGTVLDDENQTVRGNATVSPLESEEYHRQMNWFADLREQPISPGAIKAIRNQYPLAAITELQTGLDKIMGLIELRAPASLGNDIETIQNEFADRPTECLRMVETRLGQGEFRTKVLAQWGDQCAVTACHIATAIRASHIKPWRISTPEEKLSVDNGLPLIATLDCLFDRGLIGFQDDGTMLVSAHIPPEQHQVLGIPMNLRRPPTATQIAFLRIHRQLFDLN